MDAKLAVRRAMQGRTWSAFALNLVPPLVVIGGLLLFLVAARSPERPHAAVFPVRAVLPGLAADSVSSTTPTAPATATQPGPTVVETADGTFPAATPASTTPSATATTATSTATGTTTPTSTSTSTATATGTATSTSTATSTATATSTSTATATPTASPTPDGAPPLPDTSASDLASSVSFLHAGPNPAQTGVTPGSIDSALAALVSGYVYDRDTEAPLAGVLITVLGHPEWGGTLTRADGTYDFALNGQRYATLRYSLDGYVNSQRQIFVPALEYVTAPDVAMVPVDGAANVVNLANPGMKVARGSSETDGAGTRRATVLFPEGTTATLQPPVGPPSPLSSLTLRITEFTVGPNGLEAMPAELPPASKYTYAFDVSADEDGQIMFNQPVPFYVEGFVGFPVGVDAPLGYYDEALGLWLPLNSGRVVKVVAVNAGVAELDVDGDDVADAGPALAALGITPDELAAVGALYAAGQVLWRVQLPHFSVLDINWARADTDLALLELQTVQPIRKPLAPEVCTECPGSAIELENSGLNETIGLTGVPSALHYSSIRTQRKGELVATLTGATVPAELLRIEVTVNVAGQVTRQTFLPGANLSWLYTWDGNDGFGRRVWGAQEATVRIENVFQESYGQPSEFGGPRVVFSTFLGPATRNEGHITKEFKLSLAAAWGSGAAALGGWSLSDHHVYDPGDRTLYLGNGERIVDADQLGGVLNTALGAGPISHTSAPPNTPARLITMNGQGAVIATAHGGGYWAGIGIRLFHVSRDGLVNLAAVFPESIGDLAVGARGEVYIANNWIVYKYDPWTASTTTVAGTGGSCPGPLTTAEVAATTPLCLGPRLAAAPDGNLYIADLVHERINRLTPDGVIRPFAFQGVQCDFFAAYRHAFCGVDVPAWGTSVHNIYDIDAGPGGEVYVRAGTSVGVIGTDGVFRRHIGGLTLHGEGVPGVDLAEDIDAFAVSPSGVSYFFSRGTAGDSYRVRMLDGGVVRDIAGNGYQGATPVDGHAATRVSVTGMGGTASFAFGPDGSVRFLEYGTSLIKTIESRVEGFGGLADYFIPARDGSVLFHFNPAGRHLETLHGLTGAVLLSFGYDAAGRLVTMTDADGNVTTVTRDGLGAPTGIVGPFGQVTALSVDGNGFLQTITNPNNETVTVSHASDGLLLSLTTPRGNTATYAYNTARELTSGANPAGGSQTLAATNLPATASRESGHEVGRTTGLGRTTVALVENMLNGSRKQTLIRPDNTSMTTVYDNGSMTSTAPTGAVATSSEAPDPRFGLVAGIPSVTVQNTPGGLTLTSTSAETAVLLDPNDPFSLVTLTNAVVTNGRTDQSVYDAATKTFTVTSAGGRTSSTTIDSLGRPVEEHITGLEGAYATYDGRGRVATVTSGSGGSARTTTFAYNAAGYLASVTDPLGRVVSFEYDLSGRVSKQILPDLREIVFTYDADGNVLTLTPPGKPAHAFAYNEVGQVVSYTPPAVGGPVATTHGYNLDQAPTTDTRPDGLSTTLAYDSAGRVSTFTFSRGVISIAYSVATGQVTGITAPGGEVLAFSYSGELLTQETWSGPVSGNVGWTYDNDFRLSTQTVNGANTVTFGYDNDSLLTTAGPLSLVRNPANGLLTGAALGTISETWTHNGFAEVTGYSAVTSIGPASLYSVTHDRDSLGRVTHEVETILGAVATTDFSYDLAGRLIGATQAGGPGAGSRTYTYDTNGNRLTGPGVATATYDAQDRMLTYGTNTYAYTANGELLSKTNGAGVTSYTYDELGNLTQVVLPGGPTTIDYVIDGANRRVGKKIGGVLQQGWLYDGDLAIVAELDGSNVLVSRFVYANGVNMPDYVVQGGVTYRIITDHLGSLRLVVNAATGAVAQRMDHDEWGVVTDDYVAPGFTRVPFGFGGGLYDADTGLVRFGARDYDPQTGRWTAKDPIGFAGGDTNLYAYSGQ
ncbi:RHS repeat-associated core domain-containing protein [Candidatus Amarobacter glycogenicus]|uniref:RHS repeat-associated core domain-containing protein n=1 Tax=Candidatus Amarobacter glycogenicus TaxID=3140699 RepID=UPI002A12EDEA|nr:hypothetical protein [Dehalococcoidia bacterium]